MRNAPGRGYRTADVHRAHTAKVNLAVLLPRSGATNYSPACDDPVRPLGRRPREAIASATDAGPKPWTHASETAEPALRARRRPSPAGAPSREIGRASC